MTPALANDAATTPVLWIGDAPSGSRAARALDAWARARGLALVLPAPAEARNVAVDLRVASEIEARIVRARDALGSLDEAAVDAALAEAGTMLREHPELPQAAWLRAEVERGWAARFGRLEPRDPDRAAAAWQRAAALDGGRVAGLGEVDASRAASTEAPPVDATLSFPEGNADAALFVDGTTRAPGPLRLPAGEHQVVILVDDRVAWASWVGVAQGAKIVLPRFDPPACSKLDLARAALSPRGVDASRVRCGLWVASIATPSGARVATCERGTCSALLDATDSTPQKKPPPPPEHHGAPAWITWVIIGAAVTAATTLTLYGAGAFDGPPHETRFENGGLKTSGVGF